MPSAYMYYGLGIFGLVLLVVSLLYKRDWKLLVLHLSVTAIIHPFEIAVLIIGEGYRYLPGILADPRLDNYIGSYISNSLIVPASAVIINAFSLSWIYGLGIAAIFTVIDWYFTTIDIYQHMWWKSVYTGLGLAILYRISRWIWSGLQEKQPRLLFRLSIIYLTYAPIHNLLVFIVNQGGQLFRFQVPWPGDPEKYHQGLFYLYLFLTSSIIALCMGLKIRLRYRLSGLASLCLIYWGIGKYHIFVSHMDGVSSWQLIIVPIIVMPLVIRLFGMAKLDYLFPK